MIDPVLEKSGYKKVYNDLPPGGEEIILGETINGTFNCFYTEISKPFKRYGIDIFFYKKNKEFHELRSDMYWKNI